MSVTIRLDLPEALVKAAQASGLLESAPIGDLLAALLAPSGIEGIPIIDAAEALKQLWLS